MKYCKNSAILSSVLVTVVFPSLIKAQSAAAPSTPGPPTQNVKVVNSPSDAVPVTGAINVGNVVKVKPDIPAGAFSVVIGVGFEVVSGPDPQGTNYAITSVTFANSSDVSTFAKIVGFWGNTSGNCIFSPTDPPQLLNGPVVTLRAGETVHLAFSQPFVLSARPGAASCLEVTSPKPDSVDATVVGYRF